MAVQRIIMEGVREYAEDFDVELLRVDGRLVIHAQNEGGCNGTRVDLLDLLGWVQRHEELIKEL